MRKRIIGIVRKYGVTVLIIALLIFGLSGWAYHYLQSQNDSKALEIANLATSFVKQYGSSYTVNSPIAETKVYTVSWTDGDKIPHAAINVGGLWVTVYTGVPPMSTPTPTPKP